MHVLALFTEHPSYKMNDLMFMLEPLKSYFKGIKQMLEYVVEHVIQQICIQLMAISRRLIVDQTISIMLACPKKEETAGHRYRLCQLIFFRKQQRGFFYSPF